MINIFTSLIDWFAFYAEVDYLRRHTEFAEADIEEWFQEFMEVSEGKNSLIRLAKSKRCDLSITHPHNLQIDISYLQINISLFTHRFIIIYNISLLYLYYLYCIVAGVSERCTN